MRTLLEKNKSRLYVCKNKLCHCTKVLPTGANGKGSPHPQWQKICSFSLTERKLTCNQLIQTSFMSVVIGAVSFFYFIVYLHKKHSNFDFDQYSVVFSSEKGRSDRNQSSSDSHHQQISLAKFLLMLFENSHFSYQFRECQCLLLIHS